MPTKDLHTQKLSRSSRTYFFDIKKSSNGELYLKISCSQKTNGKFEHYRLIVFEQDILDFQFALKNSVAGIQKLRQHALLSS